MGIFLAKLSDEIFGKLVFSSSSNILKSVSKEYGLVYTSIMIVCRKVSGVRLPMACQPLGMVFIAKQYPTQPGTSIEGKKG